MLNEYKESRRQSKPDCLANFFFKVRLPVIAEALCNIFYLSLASGVFLDGWKIADAAPFFKSCEQDDSSKFMPISFLPFLA